jgi:hypothetical protein
MSRNTIPGPILNAMLLKYTVLILKILLILTCYECKYYLPFHGSYFPCTDDTQWLLSHKKNFLHWYLLKKTLIEGLVISKLRFKVVHMKKKHFYNFLTCAHPVDIFRFWLPVKYQMNYNRSNAIDESAF